ncbi:hypothetical protein CSC36_0674 [Pseudomonas aeruginosa]|nr:hypothetical protein CSC36_0674 [Pseudomonas aeruginosa]
MASFISFPAKAATADGRAATVRPVPRSPAPAGPRAGRRSGIATVALRLIDLRQRSAAREGLQCP